MRTTLFKEHEDEEQKGAFAVWDCGSPLYDSCELVSLSHIIERHMMVSPYLGGSKNIITTQLSDPDHEVMISTRNAKGFSKFTGLSEFLEKITWKRKVIKEGRGKKLKKINIGFSCFYNRLVCGGNSVPT
ncbi:uncharacterized protein LOC113851088 [Abrus precatorius]|uniref:Uncharacterized protein LOC113851088 n=1 Tax=Abrus precatorius TaxID=3816 RepID=A0A8B8K1T0_ABRPR|nr:uncharacterized protein LOC113851088 [Abrus precatorius]